MGNYDHKPMDKYKESIKYLTKFSKTFSNKPHRLQTMNKKILRYGSSVESDFKICESRETKYTLTLLYSSQEIAL